MEALCLPNIFRYGPNAWGEQRARALGVDEDFHLKNFLITALVMNFTSHYFDQGVSLFSSSNYYEQTFANVIYPLIKALS